MRILLMAGNYAPEKTASAPLSTDFARYMRDAGHEITVVTTFPHYPQWKVWDGYDEFYRCEQLDGITVRRVRHYIPKSPSAIKRVLYYGSFGAIAFGPALASGRPDLILCVTPPLELALSARALSRIWRVPYVLWIKDLVPDVAIQLGMLKHRTVIAVARRFERYAYANAECLLVICDSFRSNLLNKGVPAGKVSVIPDWADIDGIRPGPRDNAFRSEHHVSGEKFLVLYAGNIGDKQKLELLVEAAKHLESVPDIELLIVGDGARKDAVVAEARRLQSSNVRFLPLQPRERLSEMLAAADVLVLHQQRNVSDSVIPSKLLTYMASARAIVATAAAQSETALAVQRAGCGTVVEPESPERLAAAILALYQDRAAARTFGDAGRKFVAASLSRNVVLRRLEELLKAVPGAATPGVSQPQAASAAASGGTDAGDLTRP
jgi:colanic acid biosynthesis glycosyl transferase WcaI